MSLKYVGPQTVKEYEEYLYSEYLTVAGPPTYDLRMERTVRNLIHAFAVVLNDQREALGICRKEEKK